MNIEKILFRIGKIAGRLEEVTERSCFFSTITEEMVDEHADDESFVERLEDMRQVIKYAVEEFDDIFKTGEYEENE